MNKISKYLITRPSPGNGSTTVVVGASIFLAEAGMHTVNFVGMIVTLRSFKKMSLIFRGAYPKFVLNNFSNGKTKTQYGTLWQILLTVLPE